MEILRHETEIDITHKLNTYELKAWMKHLKHIQKEIYSLEKMWALDVDGELEDKYVLQQLQENKQKNQIILESLENYDVRKPSDLLCEDFQCDVDIISEHEQYRNSYLSYLGGYRILKNKVYRRLNGKPVTVINKEIKYG